MEKGHLLCVGRLPKKHPSERKKYETENKLFTETLFWLADFEENPQRKQPSTGFIGSLSSGTNSLLAQDKSPRTPPPKPVLRKPKPATLLGFQSTQVKSPRPTYHPFGVVCCLSWCPFRDVWETKRKPTRLLSGGLPKDRLI